MKKKPELKPATPNQANKIIEAGELEQNAKSEIAAILMKLFKTKVLSGQPTQFKLLEKRLTMAVNAKNGWDFKSLNGIYRDGFEITYAPNVISWLRQFTACDMPAAERAELFADGLGAIRAKLDQIKADADSANDDDSDSDNDAGDMDNTAEVTAELKEIEAQEIDPARQQLIDLAKTVDLEIVITLTREIIKAMAQREAA